MLTPIAKPWVRNVLNRPQHPEPLAPIIERLDGHRVMITGGLGSLGLAVSDLLEDADVEHVCTDVDEMDVTDSLQVSCAMRLINPTIVLHLAGAKHAPEGELDPFEPARVHIDGTRNVLDNAPVGSVLVTASTCKACDPETAYGASKLIAERLTLNAGQRVARFHNVIETAGNVFELWGLTEPGAPLDVAPCRRYFISRDEAVSLLLYAATCPAGGRYAMNPGGAHFMPDVAARLYPGREQNLVEARRGDRIAEPLHAANETAVNATSSILRIVNPHDPNGTA